jgi:hypothetical protein
LRVGDEDEDEEVEEVEVTELERWWDEEVEVARRL